MPPFLACCVIDRVLFFWPPPQSLSQAPQELQLLVLQSFFPVYKAQAAATFVSSSPMTPTEGCDIAKSAISAKANSGVDTTTPCDATVTSTPSGRRLGEAGLVAVIVHGGWWRTSRALLARRHVGARLKAARGARDDRLHSRCSQTLNSL